MTTETIVDRVRALLAKAASTPFEAERQAFEAKAEQLIARHMIDRDQLGEQPDITSHTFVVADWGNASKGVAYLVERMAALNGGYGYHEATYENGAMRATGYRVTIWSSVEAMNLIRVRAEYLLPQLRNDIASYGPRSRLSFAMGWADEVLRRLAAVQERTYAEAGALVPTQVRAEEAMREADPTIKVQTQTVETSVVDALAGLALGSTVDLGGSKLPGVHQ